MGAQQLFCYLTAAGLHLLLQQTALRASHTQLFKLPAHTQHLAAIPWDPANTHNVSMPAAPLQSLPVYLKPPSHKQVRDLHMRHDFDSDGRLTFEVSAGGRPGACHTQAGNPPRDKCAACTLPLLQCVVSQCRCSHAPRERALPGSPVRQLSPHPRTRPLPPHTHTSPHLPPTL